MKDKDRWRPTKYRYVNGRLRASRDPRDVDPTSRLVSDLIARFYGAAIPQHARGRLLDLGCGNVPLYLAYRDHVSDNICVDWAGSIHGNRHLDLEIDLNEPIPLPDAGFDTIVLSDVLEHIRKPEILWAEMYRLLGNEGKLLMNVPFYYWLHEEPFDYFRYTEFALSSMAEEAGFTVLSLGPIGGSAEVLADFMAKHVGHVPVVGRPWAVMVQQLAWRFAGTRIGRALAASTGRKFPLGYYMIAAKRPS